MHQQFNLIRNIIQESFRWCYLHDQFVDYYLRCDRNILVNKSSHDCRNQISTLSLSKQPTGVFSFTVSCDHFPSGELLCSSKTSLIEICSGNHKHQNQSVFVNFTDRHKLHHQFIIIGDIISYKVL